MSTNETRSLYGNKTNCFTARVIESSEKVKRWINMPTNGGNRV